MDKIASRRIQKDEQRNIQKDIYLYGQKGRHRDKQKDR